MHVFNGRYLLFAAALLMVWLLGRSRSLHPESDVSWTTVAVHQLDDSESCEAGECQSVSPCQQESACTDPLSMTLGLASDAVSEPESKIEKPQDVQEPEPKQKPIEEPAMVSADVSEEADADPIDTLLDGPSDVEPSYDDSLTPTTSVDRETLSSFDVTNETGFAETDNSIDATPIASSSVSANNSETINLTTDGWLKNPFVTDSPETPELSHSVPVTFERDTDSILKPTDQPIQASMPTPDFTRMELESAEITPTVGSLAESVAQEAVHRIEYGKSLSRRGATFGARQEFFGALNVIARGNDVQTGGDAHAEALGRAMRALREAQDFAPRKSDSQVNVNVREVIESHQTRIIRADEAVSMSPVEAMQRYFTFAHQQLEFAGGNNVVVAEALFCLGKLHTVMAKHQPESLDVAKAIVFHRAALASDPQNYRSYNELGVLLARSGQLTEAESLFKKSLRIRPVAKTWQNLAKTHARKGENGLAQLADTESAIVAQTDLARSAATQITWLPQQAFNHVGPTDFHDAPVSKPAISNDVQPVSRMAALADDDGEDSKKKSFAERFNLKNWF